MANGANRYGAMTDPQSTGPPPAMPPDQGAPPQAPPDGAQPQGQPAAQPNPALVEAISILQGHEGRVIDLLKDPKALQHVQVVWEAVKQDQGALQQITQMVGAENVQKFEQALQQKTSGTGQPAPHWLAR